MRYDESYVEGLKQDKEFLRETNRKLSLKLTEARKEVEELQRFLLEDNETILEYKQQLTEERRLNTELRDILSEAMWFFGGNEDAQSIAIRCEKLGITHKPIKED